VANNGTGFDLWDVEALLLSGRKKGAAFQVTRFERIDASGPRLASSAPLGGLSAGLTGRDLILKYPRVPTVPDWQLAKLMDFEVEGIAQQAGGKLSYDYNLLPVQNEMTGEDTVLLALAKSDALDSMIQRVEAAKGSALAFTPNAVAAYNCYLQFASLRDDVTMIAWIGDSSTDIALVRGPNLLFARNVNVGLATLGGAVSQNFNVRDDRARKILRELLDLDPARRGNYGNSQEEKVAHAVQGVQGQIQTALRSTLAFCQSQIQIQDLELGRVLLCGPGAKIRGMDRFLAQGLNTSVEIWDPVPGCDLSSCPTDDAQELEDAGPEAVIALGLALAPCFEDLYSIEILPEAVKKKRRFQERTVWNIAAGVLVAAFLGYSFVTMQGKYGEDSLQAKRLQNAANQRKNTHENTLKLVEKAESLSRELAELEKLATPLNASIQTMRALRETLPENVWITELRARDGTVDWVKPKEDEKERGRFSRRGVIRRPFVTVEGQAVPLGGDRPDVSFARFKNALDTRVPMVVSSVDRGGDGFGFTLKLDYLFEPEPAEAGEGDDANPPADDR
jgi:Tfp pilus assembly PilM family ATPase